MDLLALIRKLVKLQYKFWGIVESIISTDISAWELLSTTLASSVAVYKYS